MNSVAYFLLGITGFFAVLGLGIAWASHRAHQRDKRDRNQAH